MDGVHNPIGVLYSIIRTVQFLLEPIESSALLPGFFLCDQSSCYLKICAMVSQVLPPLELSRSKFCPSLISSMPSFHGSLTFD